MKQRSQWVAIINASGIFVSGYIHCSEFSTLACFNLWFISNYGLERVKRFSDENRTREAAGVFQMPSARTTCLRDHKGKHHPQNIKLSLVKVNVISKFYTANQCYSKVLQ